MTDRTIKILNDLIETSRNGELGYLAAAEDAHQPELKTLLARRAQECAGAVTQLQALVTRLGGTPENSGTVAGALHRGWINLKAAVAGREDKAILEECERGEDHAKAQYQQALRETLPADIRALVQRQYEGVLRNHDEVKRLRDQARAQP